MIIVKLLLITFTFLFISALGSILFRSYKTQHHALQKKFETGSAPEGLNGLYVGSVAIQTNWKGKKFNKLTSTGINIFDEKNSERYPFRTYFGKGEVDDVQVLKIDYNVKANPFWMHFILDELVEIEEGQYLGKLHLKIFPGISFPLGFFQLSKE